MRRHATMGFAVLLSALVSFSALAAGGKKKPAATAVDAGATTAAAPANPADTAAVAGDAGASSASATGSGAGTPQAVAPPTGAPASAPSKPAMDGPTYAVRLRDLEARVDELKDQIRSSHTPLALLSDP